MCARLNLEWYAHIEVADPLSAEIEQSDGAMTSFTGYLIGQL